MKLNYMEWGNTYVPYNSAYGVSLEFFKEISRRINKKLSLKIVVVGEAGIGKTYFAIDFAMMYDTNFNVDQIIFSHDEYLELSLTLPTGRFIILDEPSYVIGHRDWYNDVNKILVQAIESDRYRVHPLIIPIINQSLLDKTVREHLIQYMFWVIDRGKAQVYRINHSHFTDKVYYNYVTDIVSINPKLDLEKCKRDTCLNCKKLRTCNKYIWVQYERRRNEIQLQRYKEGKMEIEMKKVRKMSFTGRVERTIEHKTEMLNELGEWDITKIMLFHNCSESYAYRLKKGAEIHEAKQNIVVTG